MVDEPPRDPGAKVDSQCSQDGARTCAQGELRQPLQCDSAVWSRLAPCNADERCETAIGPQQGRCVAVAADCLGKPDNTEVCDDRSIRTCKDLVLSAPRPCGKWRRCNMEDGPPACVCADGAIDQGHGCEMTSSCIMNNGGCDPLTDCSIAASGRVCSMCPPGFVGDGLKGCSPELSSLVVDGGQLSPAFSPSIHAYQIKLPLLRQQLKLTASGPTQAQLDINGAPIEAGAPWSSPLLSLGQHMIRLRLTAASGHSTDYDLTVERNGVQEAYLKASNASEIDHFGNSVAIWGDTLVVGAVHEDGGSPGVNGDQSSNSANDSGAAYVFARHGNIWTQEAYLKSDAPAANEFFGFSVAVHRDIVAVGATRASPYANVPGHSGRVHVFVRDASGQWTPKAKLDSGSGDDQELFGAAVKLSEDTLLVGAPYDGSAARQSGAVYAYPRIATGNGFGAPQKIKANMPQVEELMGISVALDGDTFVTGAPQDSLTNPSVGGPGAAYVFVRRNGTWSQQQRLVMPSPVDGSSFGGQAAVSGDIAAIGAFRGDLLRSTPHGEVYVFERAADKWNATDVLHATNPRDIDYFGSGLALSEGTLIVGANGDASGKRGIGASPDGTGAPLSGALYLFGKQDDHWQCTAFIKTSNADGNDAFGQQVSASGDSFVAGAFTEAGGSTGVNGDGTDNTASESGAAYVFR